MYYIDHFRSTVAGCSIVEALEGYSGRARIPIDQIVFNVVYILSNVKCNYLLVKNANKVSSILKMARKLSFQTSQHFRDSDLKWLMVDLLICTFQELEEWVNKHQTNVDSAANGAGSSGEQGGTCVTCLGLLQAAYCTSDFQIKVLKEHQASIYGHLPTFGCIVSLQLSDRPPEPNSDVRQLVLFIRARTSKYFGDPCAL